MSNALKDYSATQKAGKKASAQTVRTPGRNDEVKNNAGGFVFKVSDQDRLERFLILGTDGATYYVNAKDQTTKSVAFLKTQIKTVEGERNVVDTIVDVSVNARAYKNSPALFALAFVLAEGNDKAYARAAVNKVVRTGTHLFEFAGYIDSLGGWGRAKRGAIADWYTGRDADQLAYQAVKYRQREGWTHRDLMRKAHPEGIDARVGNFILKGEVSEGTDILNGFKAAQSAQSVKEVLTVLDSNRNLPWETIPTQFLTDTDVWKKLFYNGQLQGQALVRNITRLAKQGAFTDMQFAADYAARLNSEEMIRKARLHPVNLLNAINVYENGQVDRNSYYGSRNKSWVAEGTITDALNDAFFTSFKTIEPAGKRTMLAIDISGSMGSPAMGLDLNCSQVSAAMAMTVARTEPASIIRGFSSGSGGYGFGGRANLKDLGISGKTPLAEAMRKVSGPFGSTDCAQPMLWALENKVEVDTFVVITDNETYAGTVKPTQALKGYRDKTGIDARLAVLGVASSGFTIADPTDKGQMDFVGFDANAPRVLADFSAGRI